MPLPSLETLEGPKVFKITLQSNSYKTMQFILNNAIAKNKVN